MVAAMSVLISTVVDPCARHECKRRRADSINDAALATAVYLCSGKDIFFAATGITSGELLKGVAVEARQEDDRLDFLGGQGEELVLGDRHEFEHPGLPPKPADADRVEVVARNRGVLGRAARVSLRPSAHFRRRSRRNWSRLERP